MRRRSTGICGAVAVLAIVAAAANADLPHERFESLHSLILPGKDDSQWMNVTWLPATNIWEARQKAAKEGKPILLWYMAGEPLGAC